jgi:3-phenylpropionate/cinnamic acid dioxygenase small subunit
MQDAANEDMIRSEAITNPELALEIEQFYYREARLLDERKYQQWLGLLNEDIVYNMPARHTPTLDPALRETEAVLNVEQELSHGLEPGHRNDDFLTLNIRAMRSFKLSAWADNPPPRTRRFVSNIEPYHEDDELLVYSNVLLYYSRHGNENYQYSCQRKDKLLKLEEGFKIRERTVLIDWNVVTGPSLGLLL